MDIYQFQDDLPNKHNHFSMAVLHFQRVSQKLPKFHNSTSPMNIPSLSPQYLHFSGISYDFPMFAMGFSYDPTISHEPITGQPYTWPAQREAAMGPAGRRLASHSPFDRLSCSCLLGISWEYLKEMDEMSGLWVYNEQKIAKGAKNGASSITIIH